MLLHNFDQDPNNSQSFEGSETYKNDDTFLEHLTYLAVGEYLKERTKTI